MLRELVGSRPARRIRPRQVAASAAAHAALIAAILLTTRGTGPNSHGESLVFRERTPAVNVRYLTSVPVDEAASDAGPKVAEKPATNATKSSTEEEHGVKMRLASLKASLATITDRLAEIRPAVDVPDVTRNVDADEAGWTTVADSEFNRGGAARLSDAVQPPMALVKNGVYTQDLVDEPAASRPGNPKPRYPEPLRAAGLEADVNVLFVVDTTGRVDEPSIKFATRVHELFMDAIRVSLRRARFFPARLGGTVVPQLVQQEFRFELRERP